MYVSTKVFFYLASGDQMLLLHVYMLILLTSVFLHISYISLKGSENIDFQGLNT